MCGTDQVTWTIGSGEPGARARLRLIVGMRLLESLTQSPNWVTRRLPSIRAVAAASGTHRNTVAAAYSDLASFGLIRCKVGSGSFASCPPRVLSEMRHVPILCREPELARLLSAEVGQASTIVPLRGESIAGDPLLLHPLDLVPTADVRLYPVAPVGETLAGIRSLRRGSTAIIVSKSLSVRRLMRSAIRAVHGASVGFVSLEPEAASPDLIAQRSRVAPAILFHDADWSHGCRGITSCILRLLTPGTSISSRAGTVDERGLYG
ncbi:MAG: GntR family transcriptional regulator [Gemmatimonadales bacterium]|nr:MAG: GntR family transcriptional regulator [Gemmatimonadales bacterium]